MEFKEAFEAAKSGRVILSPEDEIEVILNNDLWYTLENKKVDFKPESYALDTWEIKPEEIYVWGACDDGGNYLYSEKPHLDEYKEWIGEGEMMLMDNMTFPVNNPQKYKLVLMET